MRITKVAVARVFGVLAVAVGCLGVTAADAKAGGHGGSGHMSNFSSSHHSGQSGNWNGNNSRHHQFGFYPGYVYQNYQPRWWFKPGFGWVYSVPPLGYFPR